MKRSPLVRRKALGADPERVREFQQRAKRRTTVRGRRQRTSEVGRVEWKAPVSGFCECGCGEEAFRLHRHHVVTEQHVRREGGDPWDMRNGMLLHPDCHMRHHSATRRIPLPMVPDAAVEFAEELLGADRAHLYLTRFYAAEVPEGRGRWEP